MTKPKNYIQLEPADKIRIAKSVCDILNKNLNCNVSVDNIKIIQREEKFKSTASNIYAAVSNNKTIINEKNNNINKKVGDYGLIYKTDIKKDSGIHSYFEIMSKKADEMIR